MHFGRGLPVGEGTYACFCMWLALISAQIVSRDLAADDAGASSVLGGMSLCETFDI